MEFCEIKELLIKKNPVYTSNEIIECSTAQRDEFYQITKFCLGNFVERNNFA
jgi:hypothetical protein